MSIQRICIAFARVDMHVPFYVLNAHASVFTVDIDFARQVEEISKSP